MGYFNESPHKDRNEDICVWVHMQKLNLFLPPYLDLHVNQKKLYWEVKNLRWSFPCAHFFHELWAGWKCEMTAIVNFRSLILLFLQISMFFWVKIPGYTQSCSILHIQSISPLKRSHTFEKSFTSWLKDYQQWQHAGLSNILLPTSSQKYGDGRPSHSALQGNWCGPLCSLSHTHIHTSSHFYLCGGFHRDNPLPSWLLSQQKSQL